VLIDKSGPFALVRFNPIIAFVLGVGVGIGIAGFDDKDAARPEVQSRVAPPAIAAAPFEEIAKVEKALPSLERLPASPDRKPSLAGSAASVDATLFEAVNGGRTEVVHAEPPTELVAQLRSLEAAPVGSAPPAQIESAQEIENRSETEKAVPRAGTAADDSLLPHERL
jgi:hypothetical protein